MTTTPCVGKSELFDSRDLNDHHEAKRLCRSCPVINECAQLLAAAREAATGGPDCGPQGTWAGKFVGRPETSRRAECGTDSGYYRHNRNGEAACEDCLRARREAEHRRYVARKAKAS